MKSIVDFLIYIFLCAKIQIGGHMRDYSLMFVLLDDLIDETQNIEENLIVYHTLN